MDKLRRIEELTASLKRLSARHDELLKDVATSATSRLKAVNISGTGSHGSNVERGVLDAWELESDTLAPMRVELRVLRRQVRPGIDALPGKLTRLAMQRRYLYGDSVRRTCRILSAAERCAFDLDYVFSLLTLGKKQYNIRQGIDQS